jgi:RNA polymerase sigma-70 factor (ECF subfamily)
VHRLTVLRRTSGCGQARAASGAGELPWPPLLPLPYARWTAPTLLIGPLEFEQAYDDNLARVYGFFAYRLTSRDDAEDLTQQTFERALRAWDRFDPTRAAVATWLIAIARNLLIDHYRAAAPQGSILPLEQVDPVVLPTVDGAAASLGLEPELAEALGSLAERERELIALRYGADLSGPEIAEMTGLSLANVQQIISRSLRRLRGVLER